MMKQGVAYGAGGVGGVPPPSPSPHARYENYIFIGVINELLALRQTGSWRLPLLRSGRVPGSCPNPALYYLFVSHRQR
jgi:hypothetical protein